MTRHRIFPPENVAVVAGAAVGIGRARAGSLAGKGMSVVMADLEGVDFDEAVGAVRKAAKRGPDSVLGVVTDVSAPDQVEALASAAVNAFGRVDFLANNAVTRIGRGFQADLAAWRRAWFTSSARSSV